VSSKIETKVTVCLYSVATDVNAYHLKPTALIIDPPIAGPAISHEQTTKL